MCSYKIINNADDLNTLKIQSILKSLKVFLNCLLLTLFRNLYVSKGIFLFIWAENILNTKITFKLWREGPNTICKLCSIHRIVSESIFYKLIKSNFGCLLCKWAKRIIFYWFIEYAFMFTFKFYSSVLPYRKIT